MGREGKGAGVSGGVHHGRAWGPECTRVCLRCPHRPQLPAPVTALLYAATDPQIPPRTHNFTNTFTGGDPVAKFESSSFGRVTSIAAATQGREFQYNMRIIF